MDFDRAEAEVEVLVEVEAREEGTDDLDVEEVDVVVETYKVAM